MGDDELRDILGADVYEELEQFGKNEIPIMQRLVSPEVVAEISSKVYAFPLSFEGESALELMSGLIHAAETGCIDCETKILRFAGGVIGAMWVAILEEQQMLDNEGNPDDAV